MILLLAGAASAATLVVDPSDMSAYATIGAAISAARAGDTLSVAAGTYPECVDTVGKSLSVAGAGVAATVVDGTGCGNAVVVQ